jgi:endonuclease YncB( thermonuclease family)
MAAMWGLGAVLGLAGLAGLGGSAQAAEGAEIWRGVVERVVDGDTVSLLTGDYERLRIRLYGVDAPERGQEGGGESTRALTRLIGGREVEVVVEDVDRYGRQVGLIYLDGENVNLQLVAEGHAWVYDRYCVRRDVCGAMAEAQRRARSQGLGVWGEPDPVPPWEHRRR